MRIIIRPNRPAACVNVLGVYLSATPHGSSGQAYLSGFGLHYQYSTDSLQKSQRTTWIRVLWIRDVQIRVATGYLGKATKGQFRLNTESQ